MVAARREGKWRHYRIALPSRKLLTGHLDVTFSFKPALAKEQEQRQSQRHAYRQIANHIKPQVFHAQPSPFGEDEQPQREGRHNNIHTEEGGDMVLEKLLEEQRHIKAISRQKWDELRKRKDSAENRHRKVKPLHKQLSRLRDLAKQRMITCSVKQCATA